MKERLVHYSARPLERIHSKKQRPVEGPYDKPTGLWVSVNGAWVTWCVANQWGMNDLSCATEVKLTPDAKILRITNLAEFDAFEQTYNITPELMAKSKLPLRYRLTPDWQRVAENYAGIIIAPYNWNKRLDSMWYYGWDCASGCIWDKRAVAALIRMPPPLLREEKDDDDIQHDRCNEASA